jgi:hypothetical protein
MIRSSLSPSSFFRKFSKIGKGAFFQTIGKSFQNTGVGNFINDIEKKVRTFSVKFRGQDSGTLLTFFLTLLIKLTTPVFEINYYKWGNDFYHFLYSICVPKTPPIVHTAYYKLHTSVRPLLPPPWWSRFQTAKTAPGGGLRFPGN